MFLILGWFRMADFVALVDVMDVPIQNTFISIVFIELWIWLWVVTAIILSGCSDTSCLKPFHFRMLMQTNSESRSGFTWSWAVRSVGSRDLDLLVSQPE
jgi:hypothetical protein